MVARSQLGSTKFSKRENADPQATDMKLPNRSFLTVNQVCELLGLCKTVEGQTIYHRRVIDDAIKSGRLRAYCLSRGRRKSKFVVHPDDLKNFLQGCQYKE